MNGFEGDQTIERAERQRRRDRYYMRLAIDAARGSKCRRAQYGTIIVSDDDRVVATGYNGKPRGSCNDDVCYREGLAPSAPKPNCCLHSEVNALMFAGRTDRAGATLYVNGVPCSDCSLVIMQSGIRRLVYLNEGMHAGMTHDDVWSSYGFDAVERVPLTSVEVYATPDPN